MIRSKYFGLAAVAFAMLSLGACSTDSNDSSVPTIDGLFLDNATLAAGGTATAIHTTVSGDAGFQVLFSIQDASGKDASSNFTLNQGTGPKSTDTKWLAIDNGSTIAAKSTAANGTYTLTLTVTSASGNNTKTAAFTVTGGTAGTALTTVGSFQVGGKSTSAPSSISLGDGKAYKASQLSATDRSNIDLYVTSNKAGYAVFESTEEALNNEDISDNAWGDGNATLIAKVTSAPTTLEDAKAVALGTSQSALIADASSYVAKTVAGTYYVLKTSAASGAGDGITVTVTLLK